MEKSAALKEIAKGGSIVFAGYILIGGFEFLYKVMVARFLSPGGYGLLSLGLGVIGFAVTFSRLGFFQAFQKFIPEYRTKGMPEKIRGIILFGLGLPMVVGGFFSVGVYILSEEIAVTFFNTEELIPVLRIFSFVIPAYAALYLLFGLFLSFKRSQERVLVDIIGRGVLPLFLTGAVIRLGGGLHEVCFVYLLSFVIGAAIGFVILERKTFSITKRIHTEIEYSRIISFSLPLLFVGFLREIMHWSDTFFIGYFKEEYYVGLYNSAHPLASMLLLAILSLNSLFFPVASELHARGNSKDLREVYNSVTRWIFIVTFPLFLLFIVFSEDIVTLFFGNQYILARNALIILSAGTFVNAFFGAVGILLQVHEKQHFIFKVQLLAAVLNVILNIVLIPKYGIEGAAAATTAAVIFWNIVYFLKVRSILKIGYNLNYYKKYVAAALGVLFPFFVFHQFVTQSIVGLFFGVLFYLGGYFFVLVVTKSLSREDIEILLLFEKKTGLNLKVLKKIIKRFM